MEFFADVKDLGMLSQHKVCHIIVFLLCVHLKL